MKTASLVIGYIILVFIVAITGYIAYAATTAAGMSFTHETFWKNLLAFFLWLTVWNGFNQILGKAINTISPSK